MSINPRLLTVLNLVLSRSPYDWTILIEYSHTYAETTLVAYCKDTEAKLTAFMQDGRLVTVRK